jgi:hypothetical protein
MMVNPIAYFFTKKPARQLHNERNLCYMYIKRWLHSPVLAIIIITTLLTGAVAPALARESNPPGISGGSASPLAPTGDPAAMAAALAEDPSWITGSTFLNTPNAVASGVFSTPLTFFPSGSDENYAVMSSGNVSSIPIVGSHASTNLLGGNVRGDSDFDVTIWEVDLDVPEGMDCLRLDFQFLSEEYPDYVGSSVNDAFIAELDTSDWTTHGSLINAPNNFAFDADGNVISINSLLGMAASNGAGTAFNDDDGPHGGATPLLTAQTPITPGAHTLYLSIFDQGDRIYDSAVFLDNLLLGSETGGCAAGVVELDLGDAPDPTYPTLLASDGARHIISSLFLGASVDSEADGQPDASGTGDDLADTDDEDGVTFTSDLLQGGAAELEVVASGTGKLNAWVDFNADGDWADASEQVFADADVVTGTNDLNFSVPEEAVTGETFVRFRLDSNGGLSYTGQAADGEVEDYQVTIDEAPPVELDLGDAPDPTYPTLLASDGARHIISSLFLGASVDSEADGQPDATATGDDLADTDDEDGVTFTSDLLQGGAAELEVVGSGTGKLNAWVDFNADGDWADAGEQVFTDEDVAAGPNSLNFTIPSNAAPGETFSRFRLDSTGGLSYTGQAADGEVEDYLVSIEEAPVLELDLGDAPQLVPTTLSAGSNIPIFAYPTLLMSDGARHIAGSLYMGAAIDVEADGQPDASAAGDDLAGIDDEDGVTFAGELVQGSPAELEVVASGAGVLNAWVDFNADYDWADIGEQIFNDEEIAPGKNNLSFSMPPEAVIGETFARFRLDSGGGLSYTGQAGDGEVEDYQITIVEPEDVTYVRYMPQVSKLSYPWVYAEDFEDGAGPEWSNPEVDTAPGGQNFLGQFGSQPVTLGLDGLPAHSQVSVTFDLYVIRSWDGNNTAFGPDIWSFGIQGQAPQVYTTFRNFSDAIDQAYPGNYPGGSNPAFTGAAEVNTLGYDFAGPRDATYRLSFTIDHTGEALSLEFLASGLQGLADESWGLDNIQVFTIP